MHRSNDSSGNKTDNQQLHNAKVHISAVVWDEIGQAHCICDFNVSQVGITDRRILLLLYRNICWLWKGRKVTGFDWTLERGQNGGRNGGQNDGQNDGRKKTIVGIVQSLTQVYPVDFQTQTQLFSHNDRASSKNYVTSIRKTSTLENLWGGGELIFLIYTSW